MRRIVLGIDPGLGGGFAAIGPEVLELFAAPVVQVGKRRQLDEQGIVEWLMPYAAKGALAFIESVAARPGQGVVSMFSFGTAWGLVRGICAALGLPYQLVRPQEWQKVMLAGQPKGSEYLVASRLWPSVDFRASGKAAKPHDGLVDAALIAEWGRRNSRHGEAV